MAVRCVAAEFGASIPLSPGLSAPIAVASPRSGCEFPGPGSLTGKAVLVQRGMCSFETKAGNMQQAGAVAVVVINNDGTAAFQMPPGGAHGRAPVTIPAAMVSRRDGTALLDAIEREMREASIADGASSVFESRLRLQMVSQPVRLWLWR